jgi:molybdate transport repressor ModE-like protein
MRPNLPAAMEVAQLRVIERMKEVFDRWSGLDLRHLAAFEAVAETRSFAAAAQRLGYTQPAVSHQIATLEQIVGQRLFERKSGGRRAGLTDAGALFVKHVDGMSSRLAAARADLDVLGSAEGAALRVGAFQSVGARIIPLVLERLSDPERGGAVELIERADERELLRMLADGELDFAFTLLPIDGPGCSAIELMRDPYYLVGAAGDERLGAIESLAELDGQPLVGPSACRSSEMIDSHLRSAGIAPEYAVRTDDNFALKGLVERGVGLAFVSELTLQTLGAGIDAVSVDHLIPARRIALAWSRDRELLPRHDRFLLLAQAVCNELTETTKAASRGSRAGSRWSSAHGLCTREA